jgi:hypothetical protein
MESLVNILSWIGRTSRLIQTWSWIKMWFSMPKKIKALEAKLEKSNNEYIRYCPNPGCEEEQMQVFYTTSSAWSYTCNICQQHFWFPIDIKK